MNLIRYHFPNLTTRSPFDRLTSLREEVDRLFGKGTGDPAGGYLPARTPALDLYDEKDRLLVSVELPGMSKDGINITQHEGVLTVSGERSRTGEAKEGEYFRGERSFGKFRRSVTLPTVVDAANIKATYKDGVLIVELPKAEEAKPKQIQVNVS